MRRTATYRTMTSGLGDWIPAIALVLTIAVSFALPARAEGDDALKILKAMSEHLASQKNVSATFDTDIEVITSQLQKLQFTSSGELQMSRPDKLRVTRAGGYSDVELVYDGATATLLGKHNNVYAQVKMSGPVDGLVDRLRDELQVAIPGADLLLTRVFDQMMEDVVEAKYIGHGVIDGVECDHLAFRNEETDWQLWVERGPKPVPRKYVITSKATTAAPQYTLRIKSWTDTPASPDAFAFKAPSGAKSVNFAELQDMDEVPPGTAKGDKK
jgi:hypothetical protein